MSTRVRVSNPPERLPGQWVSDKSFIAVDVLENKFSGGKIDPVKQRETNEKVTDKARGFLESKGVHIPKAVGFDLRAELAWR
jgi:hypothetical protein